MTYTHILYIIYILLGRTINICELSEEGNIRERERYKREERSRERGIRIGNRSEETTKGLLRMSVEDSE